MITRLFVPFVAGMILTATAIVPASIPDPVKLDTGLVSGIQGTSAAVRVFKGIPFAAPPVGALRWKAPQRPARWRDVRKADQFGPRCMQGGGGQGAQAMSEDCLYLNVWTASASASEKRPVMVWSYWTNFAATGDPNGKGLPVWPQYRDKANGRAMILCDKVEAEASPDTPRLTLYDSLFSKQLAARKTH